MIIYVSIRFKFSYGVSAIIALVHDSLMVLILFSLLRLEVNSMFIAAILSIIGYSINNTIVIFDRIRENKTKLFKDKIKKYATVLYEQARLLAGLNIEKSIAAGDMVSSLIAFILAGSMLGFLTYNFHPAKIFMGEAGSAFLGFTLGTISIMGMIKSYTTLAIVIPLVVLGLPIFDTAFAIIRRLIKHKPISEGDKDHTHHQFLKMNFSQRKTVLIIYAINIFHRIKLNNTV